MRPNGALTGPEPPLAAPSASAASTASPVSTASPASAASAASTADGGAIDALFRAHAIGLIRLALLLTGDRTTAEDVVQDSFLGLYRGWSRLRDPERALGYLRTSVVNGCRSVRRARRTAWTRGDGGGPGEQQPPVWSAEAAAMAGESQREVLTAVAKLPRRQREVLALRYYAGLNDTEIASVLRVSRGTVSSTASRALAALARQLRPDEGEEYQ